MAKAVKRDLKNQAEGVRGVVNALCESIRPRANLEPGGACVEGGGGVGSG